MGNKIVPPVEVLEAFEEDLKHAGSGMEEWILLFVEAESLGVVGVYLWEEHAIEQCRLGFDVE